MSYLVAELWDEDDLIARWTSERPGETGPVDLEDVSAGLRRKGWKVYRTEPTTCECWRVGHHTNSDECWVVQIEKLRPANLVPRPPEAP